MGSVQSFETPKSRGGRPGKIDAPLNKKLSEVKWGEYRLGDLFEVKSYTKRFDANKVIVLENGKYPYVVRMSSNNGQKGYIDEDEIYLNEGNTISFGQDTATMFYQERPYFTGDKIKILKAKFREFDKNNAQFFLTTMAKSFESFSWGSSSFSVDIIEKQIISLPVKGGTIDFDFISSFIAELEAERIKELEAYLTVAGLKDCVLNEAEELSLSSFDKVVWNKYKIGDLLEKAELSIKNKAFNKKTDLSTSQDDAHTIPVTNAKFGDNGIMFWAKKDDFETVSMTIDIVQNGAIATGKVYPQPQETGVLWDSYLLKLKEFLPTKEILFFLTTAIERSIREKYTYEYKAYWSKIQDEYIMLPSRNGHPDYDCMAIFISAIQKKVIKDVVLFTNQRIEAAKEIVNKY